MPHLITIVLYEKLTLQEGNSSTLGWQVSPSISPPKFDRLTFIGHKSLTSKGHAILHEDELLTWPEVRELS